MRPHGDESYSQWVERVRVFEYEYALQEISKGHDVNLVMEAMSARMMKKMLHPLIIAIKESQHTEYDAAAEKASYFEKMKGWHPAADHVEGQLFDKPE